MFCLSSALLLISSYFFNCFIAKKLNGKDFPGFLYFILTIFSQIILSFEILSLFKKISLQAFVILNILFFVFSLVLFKTGKCSFYFPDMKKEILHIKQALIRDKILCFISVCFVYALTVRLYNVLFCQIKFGDALNYYFTRASEWIQNGSIAHFLTPDTRELIMPVNFDMLYMMHFLFTKSENGTAVYSYIGFLTGIYVLYKFIKELGFSLRTALWSIFVFSSFSIIGLESYNPCSDLFAGVLILSGVYLFFIYIRKNNNIAGTFSSLAFALALGVKTVTIMTIPSFIIICAVIISACKLLNPGRKVLFYTLFLLLNFLIFSSYNYILNTIEFSNPISCREQILIHAFRGGFNGFLCNFIKYLFAIFDTSGINLGYFGGFIMYNQSQFLSLFGLTDESFISPYFKGYFDYNADLSIVSSILGVTGLFVFLPAVIKSFIRKKNKHFGLMFVFSLVLIINIAVMSGTIVFMQYSTRFLMIFVIISSPVIAYSYIKNNKKFCKILISFLISFCFVSNNVHSQTRIEFEENAIAEKIKTLSDGKIALIAEQSKSPVFYIEKLRFEGFTVDKLLLEIIESFDLKKYDYIITSKQGTASDYIFHKKPYIEKSKVSQCFYLDADQNTVDIYNPSEPVKAVCTIPLEFIEKNNYRPLFETDNYYIFKNLEND